MALEILYWLQDVHQHLRVSRRRKALRRLGQGFDYTQDRDTVLRVVSRLHPRRMRLRVTEMAQQTPTAKTFFLERTDGPLPPFRAGQYINVFVDVDGVLTSRPYSIVSPPGSEILELTVRDKPAGFVAPYLLNQVKVGDELETTGPAGCFYHEPLIDGNELVFLAGGSGITPFMSIIRHAFDRGSPLHIRLLYGSRVPDDVIYGQELAELAANPPSMGSGRGASFYYSLVISEPPPGYDGLTGFLDADLIQEQVGDPSTSSGQALAGKTFYICGPNIMYDFCLAALTKLGVPQHKIKRELYGPPDNVTQEPGWPEGLSAETVFNVQVERQGAIRTSRGSVLRAPAGEPLLNSLERYGIVVPAVCRAGECSTCRTRLLSGRVFMPAHTGLRESDCQHGYIHACVAYPLEDLRIHIWPRSPR
jgi:ferredoxin-NADP reductase